MTSFGFRYGVLCALVAVAFSVSSKELARETSRELQNAIEQARRGANVPGIAVAVVNSDSILFTNGFGVRSQSSGKPVDEHTLFAIASVTKTFSATAAAGQFPKGIDWDSRVVSILPEFRLSEDYVTREVTLRDLASHRTGLARGDLLAWAGFDRREIVRRLANERLDRSFRSGFVYSNVLYTTLAVAMEEFSEKTWESVVQEDLLDRAGMSATLFYGPELLESENVARKHAVVDYLGAEYQELDFEDPTNRAPAGGLYSNALDMGKWLQAILRTWQGEGPLLINKAMLEEMFSPQILFSDPGEYDRFFPDASLYGYGLGWFVSEYAGEKVVFHAGGGPGVAALVAVFPKRDLGFVVFANAKWAIKNVVANLMFDHFLGLPKKDWDSILSDMDAPQEEIAGFYLEFKKSRIADAPPSLPLADYAGEYLHPQYGVASVRFENGKLSMHWGKKDFKLEHWHFDTFASYDQSLNFGIDTATFALDASGRPKELTFFDVSGFVSVPEEDSH